MLCWSKIFCSSNYIHIEIALVPIPNTEYKGNYRHTVVSTYVILLDIVVSETTTCLLRDDRTKPREGRRCLQVDRSPTASTYARFFKTKSSYRICY